MNGLEGNRSMNLGKRLRDCRISFDITQQQLATSLDVTSQHISAIEQDKRAPSLELLARMAEELGVTTDYLITGRQSVLNDSIPAIRADKTLDLKTRKAIVSILSALKKL